MHDVIVVGAGPAGNVAARALAKKKYNVVVLEEHQSAGTPMHCTGLISDETIKMSGVRPDILNTFYGMDVVFPNGDVITLHSERPKAHIVDRIDLDLRMANAAADAGATYVYGEKYLNHTAKDKVIVETENSTFESKVLVGADGASSKIAMSLGDNMPKEYVRGIQADINYRMDNQELFKVYIGSRVAPGFFAWMIPCGDFTRVGLCTSWSAGPPSEYLSNFLIRRGLQDKVMKVYTGKIPLGVRPYRSSARCLLAGDAAGFVKPISGGGLYPAFKANFHLVNTISTALDTDTFFDRNMAEYDVACNGDFIKELDRAYSLRKRYVRLSDADMNKVHDYIIKNDLIGTLSEIEIDHPGEMVKRILAKPKAVLSALPFLVRSM